MASLASHISTRVSHLLCVSTPYVFIFDVISLVHQSLPKTYLKTIKNMLMPYQCSISIYFLVRVLCLSSFKV